MAKKIKAAHSVPLFGRAELKKHCAWLLLLAGVLILVIVDRLYVFNSPAHSAYDNAQQSENDKAKEGGTESPLLAVIGDMEVFIDAHEKFFIVLATIAIAGFTFTLWRETDGLSRGHC